MDIDTGVKKMFLHTFCYVGLLFLGFFSACRNFLKFIPCTNFAFVFQPPSVTFLLMVLTEATVLAAKVYD